MRNQIPIRTLLLSVFLCVAFSVPLQAQIRVAVVDGSPTGDGAGAVAQLNDDTFFDFAATLVVPDDVDTLAELADYDVVVLGDSGNNDAIWTEAMAAAILEWVDAGGGAVLTGWGNLTFNNVPVNAANDLETVFPTQNIPSDNQWGLSFDTIDFIASHPVVDGIADFALGDFADDCCIELNELAPEAGDTVLATMPGGSFMGDGIAVAIKESVGAGRSVYLGPIYVGSLTSYADVVPALRSGPADQLFEQAVAWAASGTPAVPVMPPLGLAILAALLAVAGVTMTRLAR